MAITDKTAIENYLLIDIDDTWNAQITEWIAAVESYMNKKTDRILMAGDEDGTYYYDTVASRNYVRIDDFQSITSVEDVDTAQMLTDYYYPYPRNGTYVNRIDLHDGYYWTTGRRKIKIVGKRGMFTEETLPADLKLAATILVAGIINYSNTSQGEIKSESIGRYSVTYATTAEMKSAAMEVDDILKTYRRIR